MHGTNVTKIKDVLLPYEQIKALLCNYAIYKMQVDIHSYKNVAPWSLLNYIKGFVYGLEIIPVTHMEVNNLTTNTNKECTFQLKMNTYCRYSTRFSNINDKLSIKKHNCQANSRNFPIITSSNSESTALEMCVFSYRFTSVFYPTWCTKFAPQQVLFHASTCFEHMCSSSGGQNCITQCNLDPLMMSTYARNKYRHEIKLTVKQILCIKLVKCQDKYTRWLKYDWDWLAIMV